MNKPINFSDSPILPIGNVNLKTGKSKYFNIFENGDSTLEIWQAPVGRYYRCVITSGNSPLEEIGKHKTFIHDQTRRHLFNGELIAFARTSNKEEIEVLIKTVGSVLTSYVYK